MAQVKEAEELALPKKWRVREASDENCEALNIYPPVIASLLAQRGITTPEAAAVFFAPDYERDVHDPFLFDDMEKAVRRLIDAIKKGERITIHGDYDVDGVSGSTVLYDTLTLFGANVGVYLPHRETEGYGMHNAAIDELASTGTKVIITVDCGIANTDETAYATALGIDVIITDHHQFSEDPDRIPKAYAIIHPRVHADRYPFKHLAGVGSAFKLVQGIIQAEFDPEFAALRASLTDNEGNPIHWEAYQKWLLDLVCTATITDCMPLMGENRAFVKYGLLVLNKTRRTGLQWLLRTAGAEGKVVDTRTIGFTIGPRINAAGRMEHASIAFELMTSRTDEHASSLAQRLEEINTSRQKLTERVYKEVFAMAQEEYDNGAKIIVAQGIEWPMGILGLVAGKIANAFSRPVILLTQSDKRHLVEGTSRSIEGFSIIDVLHATAPLLERYGGHKAAAGLAMKSTVSFEEFKTAAVEAGTRLLEQFDVTPTLLLDASIPLPDVHWEFLEHLSRFEPHGHGNAKPMFSIPEVRITGLQTMGLNNKHLRMTVDKNGTSRKAIGFSMGKRATEFNPGDLVDLACEIEENEWQGRREIQIRLIDIRKSTTL